MLDSRCARLLLVSVATEGGGGGPCWWSFPSWCRVLSFGVRRTTSAAVLLLPVLGAVHPHITLEGLETATMELEALLTHGTADEAAFQHLFERYAVVLQTMGYTRWKARPQLPLNGDKHLVPDFLAEDHTGRVEIIDLKTPYETVVLYRERRERFTAKVTEYIAQVHEYDEFFDDAHHRARCEDLHGFVVAKHPPKVLIIGRDADVDKFAVWRQTSRLASEVRIHTYDDVRAALLREHTKMALGLDAIVGACILLHLVIYKTSPGRRQYIWDLLGEEGNRLSVYVDSSHALVLELTTVSGSTLRATVPHGSGGFDYDRPLIVQCVVGSYRDGGVLQLRIEDGVAAELKVSGVDLRQELAYTKGTLGNSIDYAAGGTFAMMECVMASPPGFRDRLALAEYFLEKRATSSAAVVFSGHHGLDLTKPITFEETESLDTIPHEGNGQTR
jgi:hypothetical protein